jgi:replicative DNA helicase
MNLIMFLDMAELEKKSRIPPNSKESEMMVLGCMLTNVNALNIGADSLDILDFYYVEHQTIYATLKTAYRADKPADIHLISEELKRQNKLDAVGGVSYLTTLAQYAGTSAFVEEYVNLVREKSILRQMVTAGQNIEKVALEEPSDVFSALDQAQAQLFNISKENQHQAGVTIKDLISGLKAESKLPYLKELQERQQKFQERGPGEIGITGIPTHFIDLDKMLNGLNNSNLMILAARPAMGKSAILSNIAENICFKNKIPVGIFSLEMSATQVMHRMICSQSEIESEKILTGSLTGSEYQRIVSTINMMQKHVIIIDDQPGLKITDIRARARRMKETYNVGLIVIDYLQLISGSSNFRSTENRQNEISEISRMLKTLARELNIPILCAAQLSRKVEERQGHRPMMSDLRESGSIENDADVVMLLFRRDYYDKYDKPGMAELIVAKNRHGGVGDIQLTFRKEIGQFASYSPIHPQAEIAKNNKEAFSAFSPED